jgi:hypothetical protein
LLDLLILTAPIPLIWSLHLATKKKILVIAVLSLGARFELKRHHRMSKSR